MNQPPDSLLQHHDAALEQAAPARASQTREHRRTRLIFPNFLDSVRSLISITVAALFIVTFVVQPFSIPSESMERTLLVGDFLLVNKSIFAPPGHWGWLLPYQPVRHDDIIVFHFPLNPSEYVVKRVIGLPGDRIRLENGRVYIDGKRQNEPFAVFERSYPDAFRDDFPTSPFLDPNVDSAWWLAMQKDVSHGTLVVPPNSYFVLGDNRNYSRDSRYWGFVQPARVEGKPFLIYFSLRERSHTDIATLPDDRLGHDKDPFQMILGFARWNRMFHLIR